VQSALDRVDVKLGRARAEPVATNRNTARTLASFVLLATMMAGLWGLPLIVAAIGTFAPGAVAFAAMAALALGHVAVSIVTGERGAIYETYALAALVPLALWCAWIAWKWVRTNRDDGSRSAANWTRAVFVVLWLGVVIATATLASGGMPSREELFGDAQFARSSVALLGLGAALLTLGARARLAGTLAAAAGIAGIVAGTLGERWSSPTAAIAWSKGTLAPVATVPIARDAHEVEVSPGGTRFLVRRYVGAERDEDDYSMQLVTGRIPLDGPTRTLSAIDAAMPNESELLVLDRLNDDSLELRLEHYDADSAARVVWRDTLPALSEPSIQIGGARGQWLVSGRLTQARQRRYVTFGGAMDGSGVQRVEVPADTLYGRPVHSYHDGATLVVAQDARRALLGTQRSVVRTYLAAFRGDLIGWTLSRYERDGGHALVRLRGYPTCASTAQDDVAVCVEQRRRGTHLWSVARGGAAVDLGRVSSRYERAKATPGGHVVASTYGGRSVAIIDVVGRRGVRTSLPSEDFSYLSEISATDARVVAVLGGEQGSRIVVYRLVAAPKLVAR
jgi:hypothetical protein